MTYPESIQYLESFINYEKIPDYPYKESFKLERVKNFLVRIDNPQDSLKCLHIAGTKGKGSTCAFIAYILREAGYKVGLYTSPHLADFRERIRILWQPVPSASSTRCPIGSAPGARLGPHQVPVPEDFEGMISKGEITGLVERLKPLIQDYNRYSEYGPLSFFEIYTSLAFLYFREKKVDFAVLETGLGGRLDATNVVNPLATAIASISYEHTQKLGSTLREIATEKAGIIKNKESVVISAPQEEEAREVIRDRCFQVGSRLHEVNKDIFCDRKKSGFDIRGVFAAYPDLKLRLLGKHQLINATVAVGVIETLRLHNINVGIDAIRYGLYNTVWPGRCEVVSSSPLIVLDGAQNIASMRALKGTIKENFSAESAVDGKVAKYKRLILVLGISSDKDIKGICNEIYDLADEVILTRAGNPRATEPESLVKYFNGKEVHITDNVGEAKELARCISKKEDLILVCGSLFVVGEFRNA